MAKSIESDEVKIAGTRYDLPKAWTVLEFRLIKLKYGLLGGNIDYAVAAGDQDGYAAYALIALRRANPETPIEEQINYLDNLPAGELEINYAPEPKGKKPDPPA